MLLNEGYRKTDKNLKKRMNEKKKGKAWKILCDISDQHGEIGLLFNPLTPTSNL